jgi:hypothetical protein
MLERLEKSAGLFLIKRNRGQTDERLLAVVVPVPACGPMRLLVLKRFHEPTIVRGQSECTPTPGVHVVYDVV